MKLEGLLVDLVPYGSRFSEQERRWRNNESWYWAAMGERKPIPARTIQRWQQERNEDDQSQGVWFGIQTKDGKPLGDMSIDTIVPHNRLAFLGTVIGEPEYWGGGYGTDALTLLIDYTFDWLDMRKICVMTMALNARVIRLMEKVGFTLEGRPREATWVDGKTVDTPWYGLLRDEWPGREVMIERLGLRAKG
jgi:RimJ/RimL family protein N-acetyltransferase